MNKWAEILIGLILIIVPVIVAFMTYGIGRWDFAVPAWNFLKGGFFWFVVMIGALFVLLGISDLKG